ncbi:hypothetical protein RF11_02538 [Thelohanellus kitauei]|uniref:Tc1-like transposase DDE domain-containing protein n=1 Tax=Thelohanellus kitauei TaxID=669202 RepID=A0A0C2MTX0_THEKT|nr:hypothetical protein RF11_02538 [Thelohanellus kitauei]
MKLKDIYTALINQLSHLKKRPKFNSNLQGFPLIFARNMWMPNNKLSDLYRKRIVGAYQKGRKESEFSIVLVVARSTINSVIKIFNESGRIDSNKRGYIKPEKLNEDQKEIIESWIDDNASIPLKTFVSKVQEEMDISVGKSTIDRVLQRFHYSGKCVSIIPERRNNESTQNIRERYGTRYLEPLQSLKEHQFIFIDECGVNISMRTSHGRSKIGSPAIHVVPNLRSRNISICAAMNVNGMLLHKWHDRATNRNLSGNYVNELLEYIGTVKIEQTTIVMDNLSFHHCEEISQQISEAGHTTLFTSIIALHESHRGYAFEVEGRNTKYEI